MLCALDCGAKVLVHLKNVEDVVTVEPTHYRLERMSYEV